MHASYKDYVPIDFDLNVKYLPNLDGKAKFVDLGTHIFYKTTTARPKNKYQFWFSNVLDTHVSDDQDNYEVGISRGIERKPYYKLND